SWCAHSKRCGQNPTHQAHPWRPRPPAEPDREKPYRRPERREEDLMEAQPAPAGPGALASLNSHLDWYWTLPAAGRAAFWATFSGWALDAYNQMTLGFVLPAVTGAFADTIGRVQVLLLSIGSYAVFTFLAGCAQSYEQLLVFSTLQGLGFGGEW